ncbi:MAG: lipopolysaccharide transport periplasmic protein LptA [Rubrivivax sp.]|jgi:lipopolysaccharide export system protein LptA|nr:lipopolysaccharide transport periplasmic protein LptA [Rubrivivax sp.]
MPSASLPSPLPTAVLRAAALALLLAIGVRPAVADRADRRQPMVIEAEQPGTVDLVRQLVVFAGNVTITQGSMVIRADRVELRESPDGFRAATAIGNAERPASYRQRRDGAGNEVLEGRAERIEYDSRTEVLRFVGNGMVRRLRGDTVADEITGALITWDNLRQVFSVQGGAPGEGSADGRVRAVLSPSPEPPAPAPPAPAAVPR